MASELKVDKFTGVTTAGSIDVVGEGNSTTTNLQQGLCKSWGNVDGSGTSSLTDSFNMSGFTDNGTGDYTFTYSNSMTNNLYSVAGLSKQTSGAAGQNLRIDDDATVSNTINTGFIRVNTTDAANSAFADSDVVCVQICGDLA